MDRKPDKQLIEIEEQYESNWQGQLEWKPLQISTALEGLPIELRQRAFLPLVEIELGRDWMWWSKWVRANHQNQAPVAVLDGLKNRSNGHALFSLGNELGIPTTAAEGQIHFWEFHARRKWGDSPSELSLVGRARKWSAFKPTRMFAIQRQPSTNWLKFPLHAMTVFGRQESVEACKNQLRLGPTQNSFDFADHFDRRFSRQQFSVSVLSPDFALLSNCSSVNPLLSSAGELDVGARVVVPFPFGLRVLEVAFEFV